MKLRNKKTGTIYDSWGICINGEEITSVKQFNEIFEDYGVKEPLIKDEKIRKAVRSWSEAESIPPEETVFYNADEHSLGWYRSVIEFSKHIQGLKEDDYTIAELCGEDE